MYSASAAALAALAQPALAQDTASADGEATIVPDGQLTKLQDLDFGRIVPTGAGGVVTIDAATGTIASVGNITLVSPSAHRAFFRSRVPVDTVMVFSLDASVTLTRVSGTETMTATLTYAPVAGLTPELLFGLPIGQKANATEQLVAVGGALTVSGTQEPGLYSGTFNLSVAYP